MSLRIERGVTSDAVFAVVYPLLLVTSCTGSTALEETRYGNLCVEVAG